MFSTFALSIILAADSPRFRVEIIDTGLTNCSAAAINELGEIIVACGGLSNQLFWVGDPGESAVALTPPAPQFLPCTFHSVRGFNSARQWLQGTRITRNCIFGGSSESGSFRSGNASSPSSYYAANLTASGRFLNGGVLWIAPGETLAYTPDSRLEIVGGLNSRLQSVVSQSDGGIVVASARYDWRTGEKTPLPSLVNAVLDERGWVAGIDPETNQLVVWDGSSARAVGQPPGALDPDRRYIQAVKENGWILGGGTRGPWLWDGANFSLLSSLVQSGTQLTGIAGVANSGMIAATIGPESSTRAVRLVPLAPLEPTDIAAYLPEAGTELEGYGEYVGCGGITGWVLDTSHPNLNMPLEFYADDILASAGIAETKREDGTYSFHIPLPKRLFDGRPHPVNVRFAGTSTQVQSAWGMISCP